MTLTNKRGIFALSDARLRFSNNAWISPFLSQSSKGYFAAGMTTPTGPTQSSVERIDYTNDSVALSIRGPLSASRRYLASISNTSYGWFVGGNLGYAQPNTSLVDRIDYATDTATASVRGPLSSSSFTTGIAGSGNNSYGYITGDQSSLTDRIDYSNDTATASPKGPLANLRLNLAATGNLDYGYWGGGQTNPGTVQRSYVDRIDYANDTATAVQKGPLSFNNTHLAATGNGSYGYFSGGAPGGTCVVCRVDYSNDTATASPKGPLSEPYNNHDGTSSSSHMYFGGGEAGPTGKSTIDRIDYSNDTVTASRGLYLNIAREEHAAASSGENGLQNINNFAYYTDDIYSDPLAPAISYGYFNSSTSTLVNRIQYSNDTATALLRGGLSILKYSAATGNSSYGYVGGGGSAIDSSVDRVEYSNDTATASPRGPLSLGRQLLAATGNSSYGWFGGGTSPGAPSPRSRIDRIDYANDTATASIRGPLTSARAYLSATGNSSFGYFNGGGPVPSAAGGSFVDRVDYSNDTATTSPKGPLNASLRFVSSTGNSDYGWAAGGSVSPLVPQSTVNRIDYSNDTATASVRGPLSIVRRASGATGNISYGYFAGGFPGPAGVTSVDRVDYSNDTATASPRGSMLYESAYTGFSAAANALPQ